MANFLDYPNAPQDFFMCLSKIYKCTMILLPSFCVNKEILRPFLLRC